LDLLPTRPNEMMRAFEQAIRACNQNVRRTS
jgi:hypothetical protein